MNEANLALGLVGALAIAGAVRGSRALSPQDLSTKKWENDDLEDYLFLSLESAFEKSTRRDFRPAWNVTYGKMQICWRGTYAFSTWVREFNETGWLYVNAWNTNGYLRTRYQLLGGDRSLWSGDVQADVEMWWRALEPVLTQIEQGKSDLNLEVLEIS